MRLEKSFFEDETHRVAQSLIGKMLVRYVCFFGNYYRLSGIITETEAYGYKDDPASHAFKGKTARNQAMFGQVGIAYVYFIYGNHYCLNVVAKCRNEPAGAVLIRSVEPIEGIGLMKIFRRTNNVLDLTTGPGRLTQALRITKKHNTLDLVDNKNNKFLYIEENASPNKKYKFTVNRTARIGISIAMEREWRYMMMVRTSLKSPFIPSSFLSRRS
ncbi:MAG: DNA-3-methyladenine glycosylase [Candidatus Nitrosocosmicus sp.]|uniref:DNA-3-methyladenine glycosylase n=1 Tax=Candidatus Nitrosocosmicus sp. FF01 TaxID=3397670 RepID=UPI0039EB71C3